MAEKLHFELVSPEKLLKSADVDMVVVPGTEGDFGVLPKHAPLVSTLRTGIIEVHNNSEAEKLLVVGGFAEVNSAGLTILAELATPINEVDKAGYEADLTVLDLNSTDLIRHRMQNFDSIADTLFAQIVLADDRAIRATYANGAKVYKRD